MVHAELVALIRGLLRQVRGRRGGGTRVMHAETRVYLVQHCNGSPLMHPLHKCL